VLDLQRLMVGGTIQATRLALRSGGPAVHLGGGFHHAMPDRGLGFCVFNDVAVAIARLRARGFAERVLVVDLDLHDGNGTRAVFARDSSVHTYSVHADHWGDTEAVESTAIALGPGVEDGVYLDTIRRTLPPLFEAFRPGLVVYVAGTDVAAGDALGHWRISAAGRSSAIACRLSRKDRAFLVVVLSGYGRAPGVTRPAIFSGWPRRPLEPPEDEDLTLQRFRERARWREPPPALLPMPPFPVRSRPRRDRSFTRSPVRYLGLLSRQALELDSSGRGSWATFGRAGSACSGSSWTRRRPSAIPCGSSPRVPEERLVELRVKRSLAAIPDFEV
jgi:hypothetical protein